MHLTYEDFTIAIAILSLIFSYNFYLEGIQREEIRKLKDSLVNKLEMFFDELFNYNRLKEAELDQLIANHTAIIRLINENLKTRCKLEFLKDKDFILGIYGSNFKKSVRNYVVIDKKIVNELKFAFLEEIEKKYTDYYRKKSNYVNFFLNKKYMFYLVLFIPFIFIYIFKFISFFDFKIMLLHIYYW